MTWEGFRAVALSHAIGWAWIAWTISWFAAAGWASRTRIHADTSQQRIWLLPTVVGALLIELSLFVRTPWNELWVTPRPAQIACFVLVLAGFAFAWWARIHLGRLWAGHIMVKEGHRIVDTGPYRLVRHPIYTGLLLSLVFTAICLGTTMAFLGVAMVIGATYIKARREERFLRAELGAEAYDAYARRTPMLAPFWPKALK